MPDEPDFRREPDLVVDPPPLQLRPGALLPLREDPETEGEIVGHNSVSTRTSWRFAPSIQARPENFLTILPGFVVVGTPGREEKRDEDHIPAVERFASGDSDVVKRKDFVKRTSAGSQAPPVLRLRSTQFYD